MRRRFALVLLLLSAFWQAFAIAGQATALADAEEIAHAVLHWQEEAHHHHNDGSVALDGSDESLQHIAADGCLGSSAVWATTSFTFAPAIGTRPLVVNELPRPGPHPDGLRRPPRLTA
jgi:hypothetical protein